MRLATFGTLLLAMAAVAAPCWTASPGEVGNPFMRVVHPREHGAFFQNWAVVQGPRGLLYAGNTLGVLEYDGTRWRLIRTARGTMCRALAVDSRGRVYVGATGEIGYIDPGADGISRFVSLMDRVPEADRQFLEVWSICSLGEDVYFQTSNRLFRLRDQQIRVWKPLGSFEGGTGTGGRLYVRDTQRGLLVLEGDELKAVPGGERLPEDRLRATLSWRTPEGAEGLLLCTQTQGLFLLEGGRLQPWALSARDLLNQANIHVALPDGAGGLLLGTLFGGLVHLDSEGRLVRRLGKAQGMPNDSIKAMSRDFQGGLWLALQHGLLRMEYPSPLTRFDDSTGLQGTVVSLLRYRGSLLAGTDQGLFRLEPTPLGPRFRSIPGLFAIWAFQEWDGDLLLGTYDGVFRMQTGDRVQPLRRSRAACYSLLRSRKDPRRLWIGLASGLASCRLEGRTWVDEGMVELPMMVRSIHEIEDGTLWIGTAASGVVRLRFPAGGSPGKPEIRRYGPADGLPGLTHTYIHRLGGEIKTTSHAGIYRYLPDRDRFEPDPEFSGLFPAGPRWVYTPREDRQGNLWMHSCDEARGINEPGRATPGLGAGRQWDPGPVMRFSGNWVEAIRVDDDGVVWFGSSDGLARLDTAISKAYDQPFRTLLRGATAGQERRLVLGGGDPPRIPFAANHLRFEFAAASFEVEGANRYQVFLQGYDPDWSEWTQESYREYTNLPEGRYFFRVRARNVYGVLGTEDSVAFVVLPPWYRSWWAYALYGLGSVGIVGALLQWRMKALRARNQELEGKVRERTQDLATRYRELETLDETVKAINREVALQPLLEAILHQSLRQFPQADKGAVMLQGEEDHLFRVQASVGFPAEVVERVLFTEAEVLQRYTQGSQILDQGVFLVRELQGAPGHHRLEGMALPSSLLAMTLALETRIVGFLILESYTDPDAFRESDAERLRRFREHAMTALTKARMIDRLDALTTQLREVNQQKNQFLGIVAHDLRNPLNGIVLAAQLLDGEEDLVEVGRIAGQIMKEGMEMSVLLGRFLDIAAIESGAIAPEPTPLDLPGLARHIADRHARRAEEKGIALEVVDEGHVNAWGDFKFMKEILDNLLSNALKFSPPGTRITLRVSAAGGFARVSVEDQGPGLTAQDRQKLFGRFSRLSAQPTGGEKSTGLGLSIVKHMVDAMEGRIWVESEPGKGAAFRVELPAWEPPGNGVENLGLDKGEK